MAESGMIDLGKSMKETSALAEPAKKDSGVSYPTLFIRDVDGLYDLPDGEFTFTGVAKKISSEIREREGKTTHSCELEIHSIKPEKRKAKKTKEADERLDESFDKIAKKKSADYDDEE